MLPPSTNRDARLLVSPVYTGGVTLYVKRRNRQKSITFSGRLVLQTGVTKPASTGKPNSLEH